MAFSKETHACSCPFFHYFCSQKVCFPLSRGPFPFYLCLEVYGPFSREIMLMHHSLPLFWAQCPEFYFLSFLFLNLNAKYLCALHKGGWGKWDLPETMTWTISDSCHISISWWNCLYSELNGNCFCECLTEEEIQAIISTKYKSNCRWCNQQFRYWLFCFILLPHSWWFCEDPRVPRTLFQPAQ